MIARAVFRSLCPIVLGLWLASGLQALQNQPPTAVPGFDRDVATGTSVLLDGRASFDPEGQPLVYRWRFAGLPSSSQAVLFGADTALASFTSDVPGDYFVELTVDDGTFANSKALRVRASGQGPVQRPVAIVRAPSQARTGDRITLDAAGSTSPSGVALAYSWRQTFGNPVRLSAVDTPQISFRSFDPGFATIELIVSDGVSASVPLSTTVILLDLPPSAPAVDAGGDRVGVAGKAVTLSARVLAPRGPDSVTLRWTYESGPAAQLAMTDRARPTATFVPPVAGFYGFRFSADDGQQKGEDSLTVQVLAAPTAAGGSSGCSMPAAGGSSLDLLALLTPFAALVSRRRRIAPR
ncbi:MAG: hypothetical protein HY303_13360 [Candidatus Wallbacteria bacterium]|nr:hypothetical protein [Candidatus Wallbacteria bacterium]